MEKLVSSTKAAAVLGVHVDTLRRWDNEGELVASRTSGHHRRYALADLQARLVSKEQWAERTAKMCEVMFLAILEEIYTHYLTTVPAGHAVQIGPYTLAKIEACQSVAIGRLEEEACSTQTGPR